MHTDSFALLAEKARSGDRRALAKLLRLSHTPVAFLCRKLLRSEGTALAMTRQILSAVPRQLARLQDPQEYEVWICRIAASRCMAVPNRAAPPPPPRTEPAPGAGMDEVQTALLTQQLVEELPDGPRTCLLLYSCARLKLRGISQLTGFTEAQVLDHLNQAQKAVNHQLREYHRMGVHFSAIPALSSLVRTAMYHSGDSKAAAVMVRGILAEQPVPKKEPRRKLPLIPLLCAAAGLMLLLLILMILAIPG